MRAPGGGQAAVGVEGEPELGGDDDLAAERFDGFPDEFLVDERAVYLRYVEKVTPRSTAARSRAWSVCTAFATYP